MILAMESSAKPASAAVCQDGKLLGQYFQNSGMTHSRTLLTMVRTLLKNLDMQISDVDIIAVSRGPGSFTGIRIGVSAAKGLAWGVDKPVCGVSTLEAMAYQAQFYGALLCPVMDARRGQVYNALFKGTNGAPERLCEDRAISLEALAAELKETQKNPPPQDPRPQTTDHYPLTTNHYPLLTGDGATITQEYLQSAGITTQIAPSLLRYQTAYGVALAAEKTKPTPATDLEPTYLRPSQAERERNA